MIVKYLIVESDLRSAELCARYLFKGGLISKRAESVTLLAKARGFLAINIKRYEGRLIM